MKDQTMQQAGSAFLWRGLQMGGTKLIFLVRLLVLARLLTPDDFGLVTIAASAIGFMMSVTNFGMAEALIQGKDVDEDRYNAGWTVNVSRAVVVTVAVLFAAPLVATIFSEPRSVNVIRLLAFQPLLDALASIKIASLTRDLHFRPLAILRLSAASVNVGASIVFAIQFGVWGLVAGAIAGSATYLLLSYFVAPHRPRFLFDRVTTRPLLNFGRWIYFSSLIAMVGHTILRITISRQLGAAELGLYYLATQIAFLPVEFASEVIGSVAFPLYARLQASAQLAVETFQRIFTGTAALLYPACFLLLFLAQSLVSEVLGPNWFGTTPIIRVLTLVSIIGILGETTGPIFRGLGQPYRVTFIELVQTIILIIFVWNLADNFGVVGAAAAWLPAVFASQIVSIIFMHQMFKRPFVGLTKPFTPIVIASVIGGIVGLAISQILSGLSGFLVASILGIIIAYLLMWLSDRRLHLGYMHNLAIFFPLLAQRLGIITLDSEPSSA